MRKIRTIVLLRNSLSRKLLGEALKKFLIVTKGHTHCLIHESSYSELVASELSSLGSIDFEIIKNYADRVEMEAVLYKLLKSGQCTSDVEVLYLSEFDVMRVASVTDLVGYGSPMSLEQAEKFRDKYSMKESLRQLDIPCAEFWPVDSFSDFMALKDKINGPLVIKPRRLGGSIGVEKINQSTDFSEYLINNGYNKRSLDESFDLLAESYVSDEMIHVDGYWDGQEINTLYTSEYLNNCMDFTAESIWGSRLLRCESIEEQAREYIQSFCQKNAPGSSFVYHAEFFVQNERLIFNEIARRIAGGRIPEYIHRLTGENLFLSSLNVQSSELKSVPQPNQAWFSVRPTHRSQLVPEDQLPVEVIELAKNENFSLDPRNATHVGDEIFWGIVNFENKEGLSRTLSKIVSVTNE